jgi:hypothetical protein
MLAYLLFWFLPKAKLREEAFPVALSESGYPRNLETFLSYSCLAMIVLLNLSSQTQVIAAHIDHNLFLSVPREFFFMLANIFCDFDQNYPVIKKMLRSNQYIIVVTITG